MNKKLIASLLGGGVVILASTLGGLELDKNIKYKNQVIYYKKIIADFKSKAPNHIKKEYYLPEWENDALWKTHYDYHTKITGEEREQSAFKKQYGSSKEFRDFCYKEASKNDYENCSDGNGWCGTCPRGENWSRV